MTKMWKAFGRHTKKVVTALALLITGLLPVALHAWGPSRTTFTIEKPATYVTFNSITNNPAYGDERNFVRIKESSAADSTYDDKIAVQAGKKYTVLVYFHNNAAANLNLVATNTKANTQLPNSIAAGKQATVSAKIMADNANPKTVWDEAYITASDNVTIKYVANTATIHSKGAVNGQKLNYQQFFTNGTLIGYNALDGKVPGCSQFAGYITYEFAVEAVNKPNFKIDKTVSLGGQKKFAKQVTSADNQVVDFVIAYTNTGNTTQTEVVIKDQLPSGLTYVKGSTLLANKNSNGQPVKVGDNITTSGINIGSYAPGANAFIQFSAKINDVACSKVVTLVNTAQAITKDGTKADTAKVIVKTENCPAQPKTIKVCRLSDKAIITIDKKAFNSTLHAKDLTKCNQATVTPPAPSVLPQTGAGEVLAKVLGLGALVASASYYLVSRKL